MKTVRTMNVLAGCLGFLLLLGLAGAYAQGPGVDAGKDKAIKEKMEARMEQLYTELNLTDVQKKLLEENRNKNHAKMEILFQGMKEKRAQLRQELEKEKLDMNKISVLNNELKALEADMLDYRLEGILEVHNILTPEQFKKFIASMDERRGHFQHKQKEPQVKH